MSRPFRFRLERVRRVRTLEERVARSERATAENLARAAEESRARAGAVVERSRAWLRTLLAGGHDPRLLLPGENQRAAELARLRREHETARTLRLQAERMAALHLARRSAARALDELETRARSRHVGEVARSENAHMDEVAARVRPPEAVRTPDEAALIIPADGPSERGTA